jgi:hypothetical protein
LCFLAIGGSFRGVKVLLLALLPTLAFASKGEVSAPQQKMSVEPISQKRGAPQKAAPETEKRTLHLGFKKSS